VKLLSWPRTQLLAAVIPIALLFHPAVAHEADTVTPRAATTSTHFPIPCVLDGTDLGEIDGALTSTNELLSIDGAQLLEWLKPVLTPPAWSRLNQSLTADKRLEAPAIAAAGIGLEYDAAKLEIRFSIPPEIRRRVELRLGAAGPRHAVAPPLEAASISGYLNLRAGQEYLNNGDRGPSGWQPLVLDVDGAFGFLNTVVEGVATYRDGTGVQPGAGAGWSRGDVRLVHDFPENRLRVTAGDINYGLDGFQSFQRAGGITFGRDFGLQPYRSSAPIGSTTLLVDRRSTVDVTVNGQLVASLNLGPGQYNVRDFPFASGANDIALRVRDDVGRVQTINFPFVYDSTVLGAGEHDFQYAFGFTATPTWRGRSYDTSRPVGSMYHAVGITDQFTVGLNLQGGTTIQTGGVEARLATALGIFRLDAAGSRTQGLSNGYGLRLTYRYVEPGGERSVGRSLEFSGTYRSPTFATLGIGAPNNPVAADLGVRYGQRLIGPLYGSVGYSYQRGRQGTPDSQEVDASLTTAIAKNVSAYLLASHSKPAFGKTQERIFLAVSWFPQNSGHSLTVTEDTHAHDTQLQWHYAPAHTVDAFEGDAVVERNSAENVLRGELDYTGYRFTAGVSQNSTIERSDLGMTQHRTALSFGTALAFADGHFGVSRPISDSFVIVTPHESLAHHRVEVNPFGAVPDARTDFLGSAVLPDLVSYYRYQVLLAAADLPEGLDLGRDFYIVQPRYRSGSVIPAGTGATVLLETTLFDAAAQPMGLELGTITLDDVAGQPTIDFFTNRDGRLRVAGIHTGRITIRLANYPEAPITLTIPPKTQGRYDAGRTTLDIAPDPSNGSLGHDGQAAP
jgi:outer membrane usher protein